MKNIPAKEKTERLGSLFLTLLNAPEGISFLEIRKHMSYHYPDSESGRRKFERDKKDLQEIGILIEHSTSDNKGHVYTLSGSLSLMKDFVPDRKETETLARLILRAVSHFQKAESPDENLISNLESLLFKLLYAAPDLKDIISDPESLSAGNRISLPHGLNLSQENEAVRLSLIQSSLQELRLIEFEYPSSPGYWKKRTVAPAGVIAHRGRWCLTAEDKESGQMRHFYLDLIKNPVKLDRPFRKKPDFSVKKYSLHPLNLNLEPEVTILIKPSAEGEDYLTGYLEGYSEWLAENSLYRIRTSNPQAVFLLLASRPDLAEGLGPAEIRDRFAAYLNSFQELYG